MDENPLSGSPAGTRTVSEDHESPDAQLLLGCFEAPLPTPIEPRKRVGRTTRKGGCKRDVDLGARSRMKTFRKSFYPHVTDRDWNDWRWQLGHAIREPEQLDRLLVLSPSEQEALKRGASNLPFMVTPYYMSLVSCLDAHHPLRRTVIPTLGELSWMECESVDPLGEEGHSPVPGLVHRYPDRVLLLCSDQCATYCRYCTRSRIVGRGHLRADRSRLELAFDYIRRTPTIRDVLLSGGDPLTLGDDRLDWILGELRAIPHVEVLRIGTKVPVVMPQRINSALVRMLRHHHPLWMSIHFTHPDELTPEVRRSCAMLADAGIPLGSQTVLLNGINDDADTMRRLMQGLMGFRVKPYYIYQCDPIPGSGEFRTPVHKGVQIIKALRGHTSGYAVPTFVIDAPGGGGKIPIMPDYVAGHEGDDLVLTNYEGKYYRYPDPEPGPYPPHEE